jgi:hypothetical protein
MDGGGAARLFVARHDKPKESIRFSVQSVQQWKSIAIPLLRAMPEEGESPQFSISLPSEAIEYIEKILVPYGHYGKRRATICRNLILERIRQLAPPPNSKPDGQ